MPLELSCARGCFERNAADLDFRFDSTKIVNAWISRVESSFRVVGNRRNCSHSGDNIFVVCTAGLLSFHRFVSTPNSTAATVTMLSFLSLAALALVAPVLAQGPSTLDLRTVDAQYVASGFAARTYVSTRPHEDSADAFECSNTGFGVALTSTALLTVSYPGLTVTNGSPYTAARSFYVSKSREDGSLKFGCELSRSCNSPHLRLAHRRERYQYDRDGCSIHVHSR